VNGTIGTLTSRGAGGSYGHLRDVAVRLLSESPDGLDDATLASALFGALRGDRWHQVLASVLGSDCRLRHDDGRWRLAGSAAGAVDLLRQPPEAAAHQTWPATGRADDPLLGRIGAATAAHPAHIARAWQVERDQSVEMAHPLAPLAGDVASGDLSLAASPPGAPIVALALATTGADPRRHRVTRIAVVKREAGEMTARYDVELGGEWRSRRRGQPDADLDGGEPLPAFDEVLPDLLDLVRGQTVYAYGARRVWAFLDAERRRAGLPEPEIHLQELDERIRALVPSSKKPGLLAVAEELGIPELSTAGRSTALGEADLVARVLERLHARQAASPGRASLAGEAAAAIALDLADLPFTQAWLAGVPEGAGVYVIEDARGAALYVGKAAGLRKRLSAYVSKPLSLHRRFEALGVRATSIRTVEAPSDLEATLLEAWLIRQLQPAFNTAREVRGTATVVRAAPDDPTPRVHLVGDVRSDGARYVGPFESASAARQALDVARAVYPAAFERRRGDVVVQRQAVLDVVQLLSGQKDAAVGAVRRMMGRAAEAGDRTEVDRLRVALRGLQELTIRPSILVGLTDGWRLLVLERASEPGWVAGRARLHLIQDGQLLRSADTDRSNLPARSRDLLGLADAMLSELGAERSDDTGRTWSPADSAIVMRWLVQARQRIEVARLPTLVSDVDP
jgi:DNA polymerase III epsilon subunit-like protein